MRLSDSEYAVFNNKRDGGGGEVVNSEHIINFPGTYSYRRKDFKFEISSSLRKSEIFIWVTLLHTQNNSVEL